MWHYGESMVAPGHDLQRTDHYLLVYWRPIIRQKGFSANIYIYVCMYVYIDSEWIWFCFKDGAPGLLQCLVLWKIMVDNELFRLHNLSRGMVTSSAWVWPCSWGIQVALKHLLRFSTFLWYRQAVCLIGTLRWINMAVAESSNQMGDLCSQAPQWLEARQLGRHLGVTGVCGGYIYS